MRIVFMGGPWDGRAEDVPRPNLPYRVVVLVEQDDVGMRFEEVIYQPRRLVVDRRVATRAGDPGWRWVMVPLGSTDGQCDALLTQHSPPIVDGGRRLASA